MHEPIEITNKFKNQRIEISLLKHFLILCKTQQVSLIHILSRLRCQIREYLLGLIEDVIHLFVITYKMLFKTETILHTRRFISRRIRSM